MATCWMSDATGQWWPSERLAPNPVCWPARLRRLGRRWSRFVCRPPETANGPELLGGSRICGRVPFLGFCWGTYVL